MIKQLNKKQRKFLEYLHKEYRCLGYDVSIPTILISNEYSPQLMSEVITEWKLFCEGKYHRINTIKELYNRKKPTKYLKG